MEGTSCLHHHQQMKKCWCRSYTLLYFLDNIFQYTIEIKQEMRLPTNAIDRFDCIDGNWNWFAVYVLYLHSWHVILLI